MIVEKFPAETPKLSHYDKHVKDEADFETWSNEQFPNADAYEEAADKLALTPVDGINPGDGTILGFIEVRDDKTSYIKYNSKTKEIVVYKPDTRISNGVKILSYYKANPSRYRRLLQKADKVRPIKE